MDAIMTTFPTRLLDGYASFRDNRLPQESARYRRLADRGQSPEIMLIGCCDSRAAPETIFDAAPGELFVMRNVANLVPPHEPDGAHHGTASAIEFAVTGLGVKHVVVMGHGRCGGIAAYRAGRQRQGDYIGAWVSLITPAEALVASHPADDAAAQRALEFASIRNGMRNLMTYPWVAERLAAGSLALHGAWFDISTGELLVLDAATGGFAAPT